MAKRTTTITKSRGKTTKTVKDNSKLTGRQQLKNAKIQSKNQRAEQIQKTQQTALRAGAISSSVQSMSEAKKAQYQAEARQQSIINSLLTGNGSNAMEDETDRNNTNDWVYD